MGWSAVCGGNDRAFKSFNNYVVVQLGKVGYHNLPHLIALPVAEMHHAGSFHNFEVGKTHI